MEKKNEQILSASNGNHRPAFVYGTLMKGERAEHLLAEASFVGRCELRDYAMYHLGSYPGIRPCAGEKVYGELYLVNDRLVEELDAYEEEGTLYDRRTVTVWLGDNPVQAEAYVYKMDVAGCPVLRKAWNDKT